MGLVKKRRIVLNTKTKYLSDPAKEVESNGSGYTILVLGLLLTVDQEEKWGHGGKYLCSTLEHFT